MTMMMRVAYVRARVARTTDDDDQADDDDDEATVMTMMSR